MPDGPTVPPEMPDGVLTNPFAICRGCRLSCSRARRVASSKGDGPETGGGNARCTHHFEVGEPVVAVPVLVP